MALGNGIGARLNGSIDDLSAKAYGDIILESDSDLPFELIGETGGDAIALDEEFVALSVLRDAYLGTLSDVYPISAPASGIVPDRPFFGKSVHVYSGEKGRPRVVIPVFPGTNCEYDSAAAFRRVGGIPETVLIRNLTADDIESSIRQLAEAIGKSQILMIPGGFSGGDEPDGSGKFIMAVFRESRVSEAVQRLGPRRPDTRHLQRLPGAHQAGPGTVRRNPRHARRQPHAHVQQHRPPRLKAGAQRVASNNSPG